MTCPRDDRPKFVTGDQRQDVRVQERHVPRERGHVVGGQPVIAAAAAAVRQTPYDRVQKRVLSGNIPLPCQHIVPFGSRQHIVPFGSRQRVGRVIVNRNRRNRLRLVRLTVVRQVQRNGIGRGLVVQSHHSAVNRISRSFVTRVQRTASSSYTPGRRLTTGRRIRSGTKYQVSGEARLSSTAACSRNECIYLVNLFNKRRNQHRVRIAGRAVYWFYITILYKRPMPTKPNKYKTWGYAIVNPVVEFCYLKCDSYR